MTPVTQSVSRNYFTDQEADVPQFSERGYRVMADGDDRPLLVCPDTPAGRAEALCYAHELCRSHAARSSLDNEYQVDSDDFEVLVERFSSTIDRVEVAAPNEWVALTDATNSHLAGRWECLFEYGCGRSAPSDLIDAVRALELAVVQQTAEIDITAVLSSLRDMSPDRYWFVLTISDHLQEREGQIGCDMLARELLEDCKAKVSSCVNFVERYTVSITLVKHATSLAADAVRKCVAASTMKSVEDDWSRFVAETILARLSFLLDEPSR